MNMKIISGLYIRLRAHAIGSDSACGSTPQGHNTETSIDQSIIESEVKKYYRTLELPWYSDGSQYLQKVGDALYVNEVEVIDRFVSDKEAKIICSVTFLVSNDIYTGSGWELAFAPLIDRGERLRGENITIEETFTFLEYENGWRLDHSKLDE